MSERDSVYASAGVDYETLDAAKRLALEAAARTTEFALTHGAALDDRSRGEPAVVLEVGAVRLGFVLECLGTKSMIAGRFERESGIDRFDAIGYDTVAAVVNDLVCVGALPFVVNAYFATGAASFYQGTRHASLIAGWERACRDAGAAWGGGESPTLSGLVAPDEIDLAGSAIGRIPDGVAPLLGADLAPGDEIVLVASSGLHANGASLVRSVADRLDGGLLATLASGRTLGDAVLEPSAMYVQLMGSVLAAVRVHYASHITGHGLRKLMRADRELTYRVEALPPVPEVLGFLADAAGLGAREAFATFNMGSGFAVFVGEGDGARVVDIAASLGHLALVAGHVEAGPRRVVLEEHQLAYDSTELELR